MFSSLSRSNLLWPNHVTNLKPRTTPVLPTCSKRLISGSLPDRTLYVPLSASRALYSSIPIERPDIMIARDIYPVHEGVPRAALQTIPDAAPTEHNTLCPWLFDHAPLILGSALGMFASNIFLYAFRNGSIVHVSLHFLSSLSSRVHQVATAIPRSVCGTYLWTSQLSRHIYLLVLCAFCQAVILPCLVVSQLIGWAGLAWFSALRVLYSSLRIVSKVAFEVLAVNTDLYCAVVVASKAVTSRLRWMWDWTTDLHDAAIAFVGGTKSMLSSVDWVSAFPSRRIFLKDSAIRSQHRTNEEPEDSSSASPSCLTAHPSTGTAWTFACPGFNPGPTKTNKRATTVDFVIGYEVDVTHEGAHCRFPIQTTIHLRLALSDQLQSGTIESLESPVKVDVMRPNDTDDVLNRFDDDFIESPRKDTPDGHRTRPRKEAIEEMEEHLIRMRSPIPVFRISRRHSGSARQDDSPLLRSPPVTSPAFWCPPGTTVQEI